VGVDWPEDNKVIIVLEWLGMMLFIALAMNMVVFVYTVRSIFRMLAKFGRMCAKLAASLARRFNSFEEDK
tara:strand:- start:123 stop:332 length:210 start_codon:yes stop_codon:yes gene_type:complete